MTRFWMLMVVVCMVLCSTVYGQEVPVQIEDANDGWRVWFGMGTSPDFGQMQELRIGYKGLLPDIELAVGVLHKDVPEEGVDDWPIRGYAIAHAIDADMIASALGKELTLPKGNAYIGLFAEYSYDREDEWSGGYVVGALVEWPRKWQTYAEYQKNLFNTSNEDDAFFVGLVRRLK